MDRLLRQGHASQSRLGQVLYMVGYILRVYSLSQFIFCYDRERYLTAATYLSSRAFPSSLLSPTPSLKHSPLTEPVLLPGIDSLNHARGQPVSWVVRYPDNVSPSSSLQEPKISLILHTSATAGDELFNNYGPKPNSELILGYGFSLPQNLDDTILLKIGGIEGHKWEIGRNAIGAEGLWKEILGSFIDDPASEPDYEDVLDASSMLLEMVQALLDRLPVEAVQNFALIRPEVSTMFRDYVEGMFSEYWEVRRLMSLIKVNATY